MSGDFVQGGYVGGACLEGFMDGLIFVCHEPGSETVIHPSLLLALFIHLKLDISFQETSMARLPSSQITYIN